MPDPTWAPDIRRRLTSLSLSPEREAEIVDELSQHLDDRWQELVAAGASAEEARARALAAFADEHALAARLAPLRQAHVSPVAPAGAPHRHVFGDLAQDLRYARRMMAASPGFTLVAILSLALGIGANVAIFSVWKQLLHTSLPGVAAPQELVMLSNPTRSGSWTGRVQGARDWLSYGEFEQLRDHGTSFASLMASQSSLWDWPARIDGGEPEVVSGRLVSGDYFRVLGVDAGVGRVFNAAHDRAAAPEVVISHSYWQRRFGSRPDIVGRTLTIRETPFAIIGVGPRAFIGETMGQQPDVWLPMRLQATLIPGTDRLHDTPPEKSMWLHVFGRLKPGVTLAQADAEANALFRAGLDSFYGATAVSRDDALDQRLVVRPAARGASRSRTEFSQSLTLLLIAVAVLLLIACANLANLLLARGAARRPEMALRVSLGASRGRLIRQLVTESVVLALLGGVAGLIVAAWLQQGLVAMLAVSDVDFRLDFALDPAMVLFVVVATIGSALVFGLLPAIQATRSSAASDLKDHGRTTSGSRRQLRSGRALVGVQLALTLPLLVGAGLLAATVDNLRHADLGYPAKGLVMLRVNLREGNYTGERREALLQSLRQRFQAMPDVQGVSYSQLGLFTGGESTASIEIDGVVAANEQDRESALDAVGPGYFSTLGVALRRGREIDERDGAEAKVCVINEAFARRFFEGRDPIGKRLTTGTGETRTAYEIVGVAANARTQGLRAAVEPRFYIPQRPSSSNTPTFLIRTETGTARVMAAARTIVQGVDASIPILSVTSIDTRMAGLTAQDRATARLAAAFAIAALALAAIGLYGVLSYAVSRRRVEMAIRLALGAPRERVLAMVVGETLAVIVLGLAIGGALAMAGSRVTASRLYGIQPQDPLTLVIATALLLAVALAAAAIPALRASRVDPLGVLRHS